VIIAVLAAVILSLAVSVLGFDPLANVLGTLATPFRSAAASVSQWVEGQPSTQCTMDIVVNRTVGEIEPIVTTDGDTVRLAWADPAGELGLSSVSCEGVNCGTTVSKRPGATDTSCQFKLADVDSYDVKVYRQTGSGTDEVVYTKRVAVFGDFGITAASTAMITSRIPF
jgi:hypothetical protein